MPRYEGPGPADRDRVLSERLGARRKFFWGPGDVRLVRPAEGCEEAPVRAPHGASEGRVRPDAGRG